MTKNPVPSRATPRHVPRERQLRLEVTAAICPQVTSRVLGLLAQLGLVPYGIALSRTARALRLSIEFADDGRETTSRLAEAAAAIVMVRSARLRRAPRRR